MEEHQMKALLAEIDNIQACWIARITQEHEDERDALKTPPQRLVAAADADDNRDAADDQELIYRAAHDALRTGETLIESLRGYARFDRLERDYQAECKAIDDKVRPRMDAVAAACRKARINVIAESDVLKARAIVALLNETEF